MHVPTRTPPVQNTPPARRCRCHAVKPSRRGAGQSRQRSSPAAPMFQAQDEMETEVEVPDVGWLWTVGDKKTNANSVSAQMTVTDLRKDRISAKKSLGQNFLTDDGILRDIVTAAGVRPGDLVLEVGPGTGNLTKHLLSAGALVTAVEKDDVLYARLNATYQEEPHLRLIHGDVLRLDIAEVVDQMHQAAHAATSAAPQQVAPGSDAETDDNRLRSHHAASSSQNTTPTQTTPASPPARQRKVKVVANLPYNITTDFLKATLPKGDLISDLHIMLQEEAGVRLVSSKPGDKDYRAMSLRVALYSKPKYRFRIPKSKYYPEPGVDGALITFTLTPPSQRVPLPSERGFLRTLEKAFGERRKKLRNSLQPMYQATQVESALQEVGMPITARAQDMNLVTWCNLYRLLHSKALAEVLGDPQAVAEGSDGEATDP